MVRTLLGALATAAWAHRPNVPRALGASGSLEAQWAGLRTLGDAPSRGPLDHRVVRWSDPMKDRETGSGDRQVPAKKMEWTQEKEKMT
jgi:hypothetical protein